MNAKPFKRVDRFPLSEDQSLQAWNAADEYLLKTIEDKNLLNKSCKILIIHDRFGYLSLQLHGYKPLIINIFKSQEKAVLHNLRLNQIDTNFKMYSPLDFNVKNVDVVLIKIPKSLDLFRFYLHQISQCLHEESIVLCGFMTRHFSAQTLKIASEYFESTEQSLAWKKSRILHLSQRKKNIPKTELLQEWEFGKTYKQYPGVFSGSHIDYATQFLLSAFQLQPEEKTVLDLGCGNGIISSELKRRYPDTTVYMMDDNFLAIESAKLNVSSGHFIWDNDLNSFENDFFDVVVTNPPFHMEYEIDIIIPLKLFENSYRILKPGGRLLMVANLHLNYATHLRKWYDSLKEIGIQNKFVVYECFRKS